MIIQVVSENKVIMLKVKLYKVNQKAKWGIKEVDNWDSVQKVMTRRSKGNKRNTKIKDNIMNRLNIE